jgi:transcription antitermination factor NusG
MPAPPFTDETNELTQEWFALRVKPRHEKTIAWQLGEKNEECFLPLLRQTRLWGRRICHVELPLIPGYVFCRTASKKLLPVLKTPGVIDIVRIGRSPAPIKAEEIHALQLAIGTYKIEPCDYFESGQTVNIKRGPLAGRTGTIVEVRKKQHLVLSVSLLRRSVIVHLDLAAVLDENVLSRPPHRDCVA